MNSCRKCKERWELSYKCKIQVHQFEATSREEDEEKPKKKAKYGEDDDEEQVTIATISSQKSKHHPFHMKCTLKGQNLITLEYNEASHNFISESLVAKRKLEIKEIKGFSAATITRALVKCTRKVPQLKN